MPLRKKRSKNTLRVPSSGALRAKRKSSDDLSVAAADESKENHAGQMRSRKSSRVASLSASKASVAAAADSLAASAKTAQLTPSKLQDVSELFETPKKGRSTISQSSRANINDPRVIQSR